MLTMTMSGLDMMRADSRIISALGPVDPATIDEIATTVHALATCGGPDNRIGLIPTTASTTWRYDPEAFLYEVVQLPPCTADDLPAVLTHRSRTACRTAPLSVAVAGRYLIVDMSHGLGDARLITKILQILGERIAPQHFPGWTRARAAVHPLRTAVARCYGRHPTHAATLLRCRSVGAPNDESPGSAADAELLGWRRAPFLVAARSDEDAAAALRRRRARLPSPVSMASVIFSALAGEIGAHGIDLADSVTVMYDCRRYLSAASQVFGNFVSGVELTVRDPADPVALHAAISAAAECGRPLAALALGSHRFGRLYRRGRAYDAPRAAPRRPRAKLVFSDIGELFADSPMWTGDRQDRFCNALNEPADPEAIVFTTTRRGPDIDITATFHENVFAPTTIQSALDRVLHVGQRRALTLTGT